MKKLTLAYFGSSSFSADLLEKILRDKALPIDVKLVVSQPDKPVGRKQIMTATPVKIVADKYEIDNENFGKSQLFEPVSPDGVLGFRGQRKDERSRRPPVGGVGRRVDLSRKFLLSEKLSKIDIALSYAYGEIIPAELLNLPKFGFWNIHLSLLPKYRGPSPTAYSLMLGEDETGVTIIKLDAQVDHGPIIAQKKLPILPTDQRPDLEKKLTSLGFEMFKDEIKKLRNLKFVSQNHKNATYTRL
jgi:methionyl-tRNA formyltransferase